MKVNEFITKMSNASSVQVLKNVLNTKSYLPYSEKKALAEKIVNNCIVEDNGYVRINEIDKYIVFTIEAIKAYTNLEFDDDLSFAMDEYDALCKNGMLGNIIATFESEYKIVLELSKMQTDFVLQSNTVECQVAKFLSTIGEKINGVVNNFDTKNFNVSEQDIDATKEFIEKYLK